MKSGNRALVDRLAAEYALGTLRGGARRHFERWLRSPQVRAMVHEWEERLAGLEPAPHRVAPPPEVWRGIEQRLELRKADRAPFKWMAMAASVLLVAFAGLFLFRDPDVTRQAEIGPRPQTIYWQVQVLGAGQELRIDVRALAVKLAANQALELWALPEGGDPVSLGLIPASGSAQRTLTAAQRAALEKATQLAVSLEPEGGSPTGLPTGPVLHVAVLVGV